jgi:hypothetical protein
MTISLDIMPFGKEPHLAGDATIRGLVISCHAEQEKRTFVKC